MFQTVKYYTYNYLPKIPLPILTFTFNITQEVDEIIYNNDADITYDIPVIIPPISFTSQKISQDITNMARKMQTGVSKTIPSKTITIDNCFDSFKVIYYNIYCIYGIIEFIIII